MPFDPREFQQRARPAAVRRWFVFLQRLVYRRAGRGPFDPFDHPAAAPPDGAGFAVGSFTPEAYRDSAPDLFAGLRAGVSGSFPPYLR